MITKEFREELNHYLTLHHCAMNILSMGHVEGACIEGVPFSRYACEEYIRSNKDASFLDTFWYYIDKKELDHVDVYKRAQMDRKYFSKMRNGQSRPSKNTIIRLAIAMKLDELETEHLLHSAGFALSKSFDPDLIVRFCLQKGYYNLCEIDVLIYEKTSQSLMN